MLYGTVIGDIAGSPFEHDKGGKTKDFVFFSRRSRFTDDTVMMTAVAEALLRAGRDAPAKLITECVRQSLTDWCSRYPKAGYGSRFKKWLSSIKPLPYYSFGNGAAVRAAPAGWLYDSLEQTLASAAATAMPTHDHPEGIKGAQAVACAIYLARTGSGKEEIRSCITETFGYDLARTCDSIRPEYHHDVSAAGSVPEAIISFLDGTSFTDVIRNAVSLGGDTDTIAAIAGSIAEAFYGVPHALFIEAKKKLPDDIRHMLACFTREVMKERRGRADAHEFDGNGSIEEAAVAYRDDPENFSLLVNVLEALRFQAMRGKCLLTPQENTSLLADVIPDGASVSDILNAAHVPAGTPAAVTDPMGRSWYQAFTSPHAARGWDGAPLYPVPINDLLLIASAGTAAGLVINPGREDFCLERDWIESIYRADASCEWDLSGCKSGDRLKSADEVFEDQRELFEGNETITEEIVRFRQRRENSIASIVGALCVQMQLQRYVMLPVDTEKLPECLQHEDQETEEAVEVTAERIRQCLLTVEMNKGSKTLTAVPVFTNEAQIRRRSVPSHISFPMEGFFRMALRWEGDIYVTIDPWNDSGPFLLTRKTLTRLVEIYDTCYRAREGEKSNMPAVRAVRGDISGAGGTDAVVCDCDNSLSPYSTAVSRAMHTAAGPELGSACAALGGCLTGKAKATDAFCLPYKKIIHTATPEWNGGMYNEGTFLERCYMTALDTAFRLGARTIAFPPLSAGRGVSAAYAARVAAAAVKKYLSLGSNAGKFDLIEWVIKDKKTFDAFSREIDITFTRGEDKKC